MVKNKFEFSEKVQFSVIELATRIAFEKGHGLAHAEVVAMNEVDTYNLTEWGHIVDQSASPLAFWKIMSTRLPILSCVARILFSVQVSSAPLENDFSVSSQIVTRHRSSLSPQFYEISLFLSRSRKYGNLNNLDGIIELSNVKADIFTEKIITIFSPVASIWSELQIERFSALVI